MEILVLKEKLDKPVRQVPKDLMEKLVVLVLLVLLENWAILVNKDLKAPREISVLKVLSAQQDHKETL